MRFITLKASPFSLVTAVASLAAMGCLPAHAGQIAVDLTTPGETYSASPYTLGFEFTANVDMSIIALGTFTDTGSGLGNPGQVGLWNTSGNLLTSVTVPAGTTANLQGYFAYQSITPYMLTAGTEYIIGSYVSGNDLASSLDTNQLGAGSFNPDITVVADRYSDNGAFSFPTLSDGFAGAWLGGNFLFTTTTSAPEPGTLALFGLGLLGIVLSRRRLARSN